MLVNRGGAKANRQNTGGTHYFVNKIPFLLLLENLKTNENESPKAFPTQSSFSFPGSKLT